MAFNISYRYRELDTKMMQLFPTDTLVQIKDYPTKGTQQWMRVNWNMGLIPFTGLLPVTKQEGHSICVPLSRLM